jgi:Cu2+-exporting ATPase
VWPGRVFLRGAWAALRTRTLHMDLPIGLALAVGYLRGAWNTVFDRGPIYFDGVASLIFLLLVGRFLQQRAQRAAQDSAEWLHALSPSTARVVDGDTVREVPAEALLPGMVVEVRAGDVLPADGIVLDGRSSLDLSFLTGESRAVPAAAGDRAWAGASNRSATLRVRVEAGGEQTRLARLLRSMEEGHRRRAPVVLAADRLAGVFVASVLALAAATWVYWVPRAPERALDHAIALLVVTCPCALALATPLAFTVAIGRAARRGILVRGGDALESLARPGRLLLDKTGTVTEGRARLLEWTGSDDVRPLVLALERHATHPLAAAFRAAWPGVPVPHADDVRPVPGGGIEGRVAGKAVAVGSPAFVAARLDAPPPEPHARPPVAVSSTPVWVAVDGRLVARAAFGDALRDDAAASVARLTALGFEVELLSGDAAPVVAEAGRALGLAPASCRAGVSPEQKRDAVERAAARGPVVMVGDGVNDAAAIAAATVGIGVRGGAEACLAAADVFLSRPGLSPLVELVEGARRTLGTIRLGIAVSLAYNLVGATLAMSGRIDPLLAAVLMPVSSLSMVLLSWGARTFPREGA